MRLEKIKLWGTHLLLAYPFCLVLSFYAAWLAGRVSLGYWPRPGFDDPGQIEGFWMWAYYLPVFIPFIGLPIATAFAAVSLLTHPKKNSPEWRLRLLETAVGIVLIVMAITFLRWDPHRVVEWYFD